MADSPLGAQSPHSGAALPVSQLPDKGRVACHGYVESVTYMPADQTAAFTAIVTDSEAARAGSRPGKGRLRVIWLGRRRVPGIDAGTEVRLEGMLTHSEGLPTMFNPRYEILSRQEDE